MSRRWLIPLVLLIGGCDHPAATDGAASNTMASVATDVPASSSAVSAVPADVASDAAAAEAADSDDTGNASEAATAAVASTLPADVTAFRTRRDQCDHFRGEEADDDARAAELEKALNRTCKGTDAQLTRLRSRYAGNKAVTAALAGYENDVE